MASVIKSIFSKKMLIIFLMGFSSGLPYLIAGDTLKAWMRTEHMDLATIGFFSLVGLPYTFKFLWSPLLDRFVPPFMGRRRGWALILQIILLCLIATLGMFDPTRSLGVISVLAVAVTFFSASQDIVLDAYRREYLETNELGFGSSLFVNGYRIGMIVSGAFALIMADHLPWSVVYMIVASFMAIGIIATLFAPEPVLKVAPPKTLSEAVVGPLKEFFQRSGAIEILLFIFLYKLGDMMAAAMATPFILDLGFTKTEYGALSKGVGLLSSIAGGLLGGIWIIKLGLRRALWVFGILQMVSILSFAVLAGLGHSQIGLALVIGIEMLCSGMGTSAFVAYMGSLCNERFTATQYALLSSLMGIPRSLIAAPSGIFAQAMGWPIYFVFCTLLAVPGIFMIKRVTKGVEFS